MYANIYVCLCITTHIYLNVGHMWLSAWSLFAAKEAFLMRGESYTDQAGDSAQAVAVIKS